MPFVKHPLFEAPKARTAPLFRYIDLAKLVSLLDTRSLFFARSDRLGDPFEGSIATANVDQRSTLYEGIPPTRWPMMIQMRERTRFWTHINCWSASTESVAMWRLYSGDGSGLAVESTYDRLCKAVGSDEEIYVGRVHYANWQSDVIPEGNTMWPYVYKRAGFAYEHEVRALIQRFLLRDDAIQLQEPGPVGRLVPVDLATLVARVRVSPFAGAWYHDAVTAVLRKWALDVEVLQSDLSGAPVY
jgi:hypothetical protein